MLLAHSSPQRIGPDREQQARANLIDVTRVCVVGSVNTDHFYSVPTLPQPGETLIATSVTSAPGGKGANQAIAAARAGAAVQFVGAVGDDPAADVLRAHLVANGVGLDGLQTVQGPSGSAAIMVDAAGENMIVVAAGANGQLTLDSTTTQTAISASNILLVQLEIPLDTVVSAARLARSAGVTVMVNASPSHPGKAAMNDLAAVTDVVILNTTEDQYWPYETPHRIVTRGAHGATYRGPAGSIDVPAPSVKPVDTTGAGDVFAGVLATSWLAGPHQALRRACAAGALATLNAGAGDCAPDAAAIEQMSDPHATG